jgi:DNA-directed RNA polymerase III subunit RPC1
VGNLRLNTLSLNDQDVELLGMEPSVARPEDYLWQYISVPPTCIRPTVQQEDATNEDDLSVKLSEIIYCCSLIEASLKTGQGISLIMVSQSASLSVDCRKQLSIPHSRLAGTMGVFDPVRGDVRRLFYTNRFSYARECRLRLFDVKA